MYRIGLVICAFLVILTSTSTSSILRVGPGKTYSLPSQAAARVNDGDTVEIDAGVYRDCAAWTKNNLVLRGVGGYAHLLDTCYGRKAIWVIQGRNTTVEWIEFSGAKVVDKNGAGIRQEGADLTVRNCYFHDNEDGILAGDNASSTILIEYSEFARNGYGDGYSHNMYINHVASFTIRYCYVHHAIVGHNIKSRAYETRILYNRISDEADGRASRSIDLPNGGRAFVIGNEIHHGPNTQNSNVCGYGMEGLANPSRNLFFVNNTVVNERPPGVFITTPPTGTDTLVVLNNLFVGAGPFLTGTPAVADTGSNLFRRDIAQAGFENAAAYDYRLKSVSPAIDAGRDPGSAGEIRLLPTDEYVHPASMKPRTASGAIDIGAHEYQPSVYAEDRREGDIETFRLHQSYPNPCSSSTSIGFTLPHRTRVTIGIFTTLGREVQNVFEGELPEGDHTVTCTVSSLPKGVYFCRLTTPSGFCIRFLLVE
jgi:hypothetical protein